MALVAVIDLDARRAERKAAGIVERPLSEMTAEDAKELGQPISEAAIPPAIRGMVDFLNALPRRERRRMLRLSVSGSRSIQDAHSWVLHVLHQAAALAATWRETWLKPLPVDNAESCDIPRLSERLLFVAPINGPSAASAA